MPFVVEIERPLFASETPTASGIAGSYGPDLRHMCVAAIALPLPVSNKIAFAIFPLLIVWKSFYGNKSSISFACYV